jgi:uncharacterized protein (TIGR00252 family)
MSTTNIGRDAEALVAKHLKLRGYTILAQNWRTRWCEIDVVAEKKHVVYFVEVKYRKTDSWGDGLDAVTTKKIEQMTFAAEMWVQQKNWQGDYRLIVASVSGIPPEVGALLEI